MFSLLLLILIQDYSYLMTFCKLLYVNSLIFLNLGSIRNGKWWIDLCGGGYQKISTLSEFQRKALKLGIYQKNCDCQVKIYLLCKQ